MKKKLLCLLICCCFLLGCGKNSEKDILKKLSKKINGTESYYLSGNLEIINNEDKYLYDVEVAYAKNEKFRVSLKNQTNNHEQIILRNDDGIYVLTPSLNKSFKFQSEWPYNNSQAYLLQTILKDLENDKGLKMTSNDNYTFSVKANYSNNKDLTKQQIVFDKDLIIKEVRVTNDKDEIKMKMTFNKVDLNATYKKDYFDLKSNMQVSELETFSPVTSIDQMIYPMYMPKNTHLSSQDKISLNGVERVIMNFDGDSPFVLIQETAVREDELTTLPISGDPYLIADTIAAVSDTTVSWYSNGIDYFITSSSLSEEEMLTVAQSISSIPIGK